MSVFTPSTEAELGAFLQERHAPIHIRGGATRALRREEECLETKGLSGVKLYEPGALTLVVGAGTPLAEIEALLAAQNQCLAFEPTDLAAMQGRSGATTIGGIIATNASGSRRISAGACRDFCLGVRFVDGAGRVLKNGGRVMKNVTGYDLVKLMNASHGALGVITEVALKVMPRAETSATLALGPIAPKEAVAAMSAALGSPYEMTGAAYDVAAETCYLRLEGFAESVAYRVAQLRETLAPFGAAEVTDTPPWDALRQGGTLAKSAAVWRVSLRPSDAPTYLEAIKKYGDFKVMMDWGGGLLWIGGMMDTAADLARAHHGVQDSTRQIGGHCTLLKAADAPRDLSVFQPEPAPIAAITRALRAKFDPKGILNPGVMG